MSIIQKSPYWSKTSEMNAYKDHSKAEPESPDLGRPRRKIFESHWLPFCHDAIESHLMANGAEVHGGRREPFAGVITLFLELDVQNQ